MPRALAAALVLLAIAAVSVLIAVIVVAGITGQNAELSAQAAAGVDRLQSWLQSAGVDSSSASGAASTVKSAAPQIISTLTHGIVHGITGLASVLFGTVARRARDVLPAQGRPRRCAPGWTATSDCRALSRARSAAR